MKIERVTCIWMFVHAMNFELPEIAKKWSLGFFRPNLPQLGLFHPYFVCKSSFIKKIVRWRIKKLSTIGEAWGNGGPVQIASWNLLGYPGILLGHPRNNRTFKPSIGSWCVIINLSIIHVIHTALLKSDVSDHSKAYSSQNFRPTGIGLGSL